MLKVTNIYRIVIILSLIYCYTICTVYEHIHIYYTGKNELRDIYAIGLKTLIIDVAESTGPIVTSKATSILLKGINQAPINTTGISWDDVKKECLDNLSEVLKRFGQLIDDSAKEYMMTSVVAVLGECGFRFISGVVELILCIYYILYTMLSIYSILHTILYL